MLTNTGTIRTALLGVVPGSVPVTAEQADAMAMELSASRYDGLSAAAAYLEFASSRWLPNPVPQGRVPITVIPDPLALEVLCQVTRNGAGRCYIDVIEESQTAPDPVGEVARAMVRAMRWQSIDLLNPTTQTMLAGAVALGLVSQEVVTLATTEPDPAWEPTVYDPAPADVILGTDALPEWGEFLAAWAAAGRP